MREQTAAFLLSALCGVGATLLLAAADAVRKTVRLNIFFSIFLDFIWCFSVLCTFTVCMWHTMSLRLRLFEIVGLCFGGILCYFLLYLPAVRLFCFIFCTIFKFIQFIFKILLTPCVFLYKILVRVFIFKGKVTRYDSHKRHSG